MQDTHLIRLALVVVLCVALLRFTRSETYVALRTSAAIEAELGPQEPTLRMPGLLYPGTNHQGRSKPVALNEETEFVRFTETGLAVFSFSSLKVLSGKRLLIKAYKAHTAWSKPKSVSATPLGGVVFDMDKYLREDPHLADSTVLGYMPGNTFNTRFTVQVI